MTESALVAEIRKRFGALPGVRIFRMQSGVYMSPDGARHVRVGVPGMPDLLALVGVRYLWIECKSSRGRTRTEQENFAAMVIGLGGAHAFCRSIEDAAGAIDGARRLAVDST